MEENLEKYLPIGSVVLMKDATKSVMITGYAVQAPEYGDKLWDYIGCLWPEGVVAPDKNLLFDHKDIQRVYAVGYSNEVQKRFIELLNQSVSLREERLNKLTSINADKLDNFK